MNQPDEASVREQYRAPANLNARMALQGRFNTNKQALGSWAFDQYVLPDEARILDLGCGTGWLWKANRQRLGPRWQVVLSDLSMGMVTEARSNVAGLGQHFRFVQGRAEAVAFLDGSFDAVIANHMLYHVMDLPGTLAGIRRILTSNGRLYATTNGLTHMQDLADLLRKFDSRIEYGQDRACRSFTLENGEQSLGRHFNHVQMIPYEGSLEVTEVEPLVAYVMSLSITGNACQIVGQRLDEFRKFVASRIHTDGMIRIPKSVGMFIASHM